MSLTTESILLITFGSIAVFLLLVMLIMWMWSQPYDWTCDYGTDEVDVVIVE